MERAMTEVVIPALGTEDGMAREQAHLVVAFLRIVAEQHEHAYSFELTELREFSLLLRGLIGAARGGEITQRCAALGRAALLQAEPTAALVLPDQRELASLVRRLRMEADALVRAAEADGEPAFRDAASRLVMAQSAQEIARGRSWNAAAGFDQDRASIVPISDLLDTLALG
jgi:hypothetical protein